MESLQFQLKSYRLFKTIFNIQNINEVDSKEIQIRPEFKINHTYLNNKKLLLKLEIKIDNKGLPFSIECAMEGEFELSREPENKAELEKITMVNCSAALFPFLRETVAEITRKGGLYPLILPSVNFCQLYTNSEVDCD